MIIECKFFLPTSPVCKTVVSVLYWTAMYIIILQNIFYMRSRSVGLNRLQSNKAERHEEQKEITQSDD